ncbi:MAG: B12-binding domain-containing radical SAM protein [Ignavibacteriales bacterium]|nr:B12-binding domain-containing radical SAM protein [Ignavibacteriales bacterium]
MKVLLIIPPFTQINTPYPSTTQLAGFLKSNGYEVINFDLSLAVTLRIFSKEGLTKIFSTIAGQKSKKDQYIIRCLALSQNYIDVIDAVINFLQGRNQNLAYRIINEDFLPKGKSFEKEIPEDAFGYFSIQDKAKYYCSLLIDDLTNLIRNTISPHFGLSRYGEKIATSLSTFGPILKELTRTTNLIEDFIIEETSKKIRDYKPHLVGYTIPFPGNLLGALVSSKFVKDNFPKTKIVFGGGYVNTELRNIKDSKIFDYTDYITYDDGELPLLSIINNLHSKNKPKNFIRTLRRNNGTLIFSENDHNELFKHDNFNSPYLAGINPDDYISITEMLNPMYRLWTDGYWNKLMVAHGCYWQKCTFCDVTLDYIRRYSPAKAVTVVDCMEDLISQTGKTAFHFTDEAAPPTLLKEIAFEILKRKLKVTWWGNIRFEKAFTKDLCKLLSLSGCVAVSGGLEVADDRLLKLINKGVTLEQVAVTCSNFRQAGILVHAYLMYGFPSQTEQEIINSLEIVRQFINLDFIQSAFWHLFTLTIHSPIALNPGFYGIKIKSSTRNSFANNDLLHEDSTGVNYYKYSDGLNKALYNFMHSIGLAWAADSWFDFKVPQSNIPAELIKSYLDNSYKEIELNDRMKVLWIGSQPIYKKSNDKIGLQIFGNSAEGNWKVDKKIGVWLSEIAKLSSFNSERIFTYGELKNSFPLGEKEFEKFIKTKVWKEIREIFLIIL